MVWVRDTSKTGGSPMPQGVDWHARLSAPFPETAKDVVQAALDALSVAAERPRSIELDWALDTDVIEDSLDIGLILLELKSDLPTLIAGLLYRSTREQRLSIEYIRRHFGAETSDLVVGVLKMADVGDVANLESVPVLGQAQSASDNLRQMLVAIVDDVRVALIKLAERTCAIRLVKGDPIRREQISREVSGLYVPLAHRLGIGQLKWELEDLAFRYTEPNIYKRIAKLLDGKRVERDRYIKRVSLTVTRALKSEGVNSEISGRAKHIFSIWRKMQRKGIGFSQVHDIRAIRILVPSVHDCYTTLGIIHGLWRTIPNEFDDYIANPKANGYRSLHTAVIGPEGKVLEVQVRTPEMHDEAELGVCAHWRYKQADRNRSASVYDEKIEWLRQALKWQDESGDLDSLRESLHFDLDYDRVFVFTPKGDIVNLSRGATPIDLAYHVHTEIGHRCRGARVNGSLVPLNTRLQTGDRVQIITGDTLAPKREWLREDSGCVVTSRARTQIVNWFKSRAREENIDAGRHLLEKAFKRLAMSSLDYARLARKVQCASVEDMFAAIGSGELTAQGVMAIGETLVRPRQSQAQIEGLGDTGSLSRLSSWAGHRGRIHRAGCCNPVEGDRVGGFVTRARGVSVHRLDCSRWLKLVDMAPDRVVEVRWESGAIAGLDVTIEILAYDRRGLLRDITEALSLASANMISVNTQTDRRTQMATLRLFLEVNGLAELDAVLERIAKLPNVISADRVPEEMSDD